MGSTLTLSKNVTIDGTALAAPITIDGANAYQVFIVNAGVTAALNRLSITRWKSGKRLTRRRPRQQRYADGNKLHLLRQHCLLRRRPHQPEPGNADGDELHLLRQHLPLRGRRPAQQRHNDRDQQHLFRQQREWGLGGGILNDRTLTVRNSTFSGNTIGAGAGGGISNINGASLIVIDSSFTGNSAGDGGGIQNIYGPLTVNNSTFSGNSAVASGGGISSYPGSLTVSNSTFSGNNVTGPTGTGGGLATGSPGTVFNSTFSGNGAARGGGISNSASGRSVLNFANNIVANSTAGGDCSNTGTIGTNRNNLIEDGSCSTNGVRFKTGDPQLGALADNGGPTRTFALLSSSPAIDAGDNATCAAAPVSGKDQRGKSRNDAQCDIGAFELEQNRPPVAEANGPYNVPEGGSVTLDGTGSSDPDSGDTLTYAWNLDGDSIYGEAGADAARGDETGATPTFSAAGLDGPSSITVSLRVTDQGGLSSTDTATVNITNVAPTVDPPTVAPEPSAEGSAATTSANLQRPWEHGYLHLHGGLRRWIRRAARHDW